jgi:DNA-binding MarR family transcriptional regulator/GNAT superfamily N-acetyltransferase
MVTELSDVRLTERIAAVRRFNRFYTQRIGLLQEGVYKSEFSLTQARVLYEIIRRDQPITAAEIAKELGLDAGYLSRILRGFEVRGYIVRQTSDRDGRQSLLSATPRGRESFAPVEAQTIEDVTALLRDREDGAQTRLCEAMQTIESVLGPEPRVPFILRDPKSGDMGWIISSHGIVYSREYGWNDQLEAVTAEIVVAFMRKRDERRERCWIAERGGRNVGCVLLVAESDEVARLRLLLVEPEARGLGLGARLIDECVRFAREARYRKITLWTHGVLIGARRLSPGGKHDSRRLRTDAGQRNVGLGFVDALGPRLHTVAPCALGRRRCSSSRGMISTKLHGR